MQENQTANNITVIKIKDYKVIVRNFVNSTTQTVNYYEFYYTWRDILVLQTEATGLHFEVSDLKRQVAYNGTVQFSDDFCSGYNFLEVDLHHHKISSWLMSLYLKVLRYKVCLYIFQVVCRWHTHKHESRQFCPYSGS